MKSRTWTCTEQVLPVAAMQMAKREREVYADEAKIQSKQTVFILPLQSEERMVGSNPKSSKEPFGRQKCQGN